jgi:hypothetical protein
MSTTDLATIWGLEGNELCHALVHANRRKVAMSTEDKTLETLRLFGV